MLKTLARVLPVLSAIACGILVYFGSLHIDPRGLSIETSFEHVLVSLFAMLIVMITVGQIVSGHESTWRLLDQAQESSNAILAAFAIVFGLNLRAYVEVTLGGIEFILALIYISLDFDATEFEDEQEAARVMRRRFAICGPIDVLAAICGAVIFFINRSVQAPTVSSAASLTYPLFLVSHGGAGVAAVALMILNALLVVVDVRGYVSARKEVAR